MGRQNSAYRWAWVFLFSQNAGGDEAGIQRNSKVWAAPLFSIGLSVKGELNGATFMAVSDHVDLIIHPPNKSRHTFIKLGIIWNIPDAFTRKASFFKPEVYFPLTRFHRSVSIDDEIGYIKLLNIPYFGDYRN